MLAAVASAFVTLAIGGNGAAATADRESLIKQFPADVQKLFTPDIPDAVIAALLKVRQSGPQVFVLNDSGGELYKGEQIAYLKNWEAITGWTIKDIAPSPNPGQIQAQVESGHPQFDMFETGSNGDAIEEERSGLLAKLDMNLLDPLIAKFPKGGYQHTDSWIQYGFFGVLLTWDLRKWPMSGPHPTSPDDLFNTAKFPGKRCLYKYPEYGGTLEYPLLADGVAPDKLYPLDVNRAFKKLDAIKNDIVWWSSGAESIQDIVDGNCAMGVTWQGRAALRLKDDPKLPLGTSWKGVMLIDSGWAVPKGAKHLEAANSLLAYAFTPQNQCNFINAMGYGIPIDDSCVNEFGKTWGVTEEHRAMTAARQNADYYATHIKELIDKFNAWITS
ncbi:MAG TPA: extracellular solute-binding protein [Acetobacteraceae bacterium]|nr:extracellular solute-binding protein [Acetobacteraceae bacterium]